MAPITGSIEISRPPQDVFDYVGDLSRHTEWQTGLENVQVETEGPTRVGTRAQETRHVPGGKQTYHYEITQYDPPRSAAFQVVSGPVRPHGTVRFTSLDDGTRTRVDLEMESPDTGSASWSCRSPLATHASTCPATCRS
jgi:uncharacterized membrane protein